MLTGLGTWAGASAVAFAAFVGRHTFAAWKRQKSEELRMQAAEKIMTLAYRLRDDIEGVRSPMLTGYDLETATEELKAHPEYWSGLTEPQQRQAASAHARIIRLRKFKNDWDEIWTLKPLALAYFGPAVDEPLHDFWRKHVELMVAAEELRDYRGDDREYVKSLRGKLSSATQTDEIGDAAKAAIARLEAQLLPVLRSTSPVSAS